MTGPASSLALLSSPPVETLELINYLWRRMVPQVPACACPVCGEILDAAEGVLEKIMPKKGDWTVCSFCVSILRFGEGLVLERPTDEELSALPMNDKIVIAKMMEFCVKDMR